MRLSFLSLLALVACRSELLDLPSDAAVDGAADAAVKDAAIGHDLALGFDAATKSACETLDESACRARPECAADYCEECSCVPTFIGCRALGAGKHGCPPLACPAFSCCREQGDCPSGTGLICFRPDQPNSGVAIFPPTSCTSDVQCAVGQTCSSNHACVDQASCPQLGCTSSQVCDHDSTGTATCVRLACATDADCDRGFCVLGTCYRSLGTCQIPAP